MKPIFLFFVLFAFSTTVVAQNQLVEILGDSLSTMEVNDQISAANGAPLIITESVFGAQSFIVDTTGFLTRIEIKAKKIGDNSKSSLSLEIKTGNDPAMGSSLIVELFNVTSNVDTINSIVLTTPLPVTQGDTLVMIVKKISQKDAEWQRSSSDIYAEGTAFINDSGWITLAGQDHDFTSYVEVPDNSAVSYFSVADDGLIKAKNRITNVTDPISAQDAATKRYVDLLEAKLDSLITALNPNPHEIGDCLPDGVVFYIFQSGDAGYVDGETHGLIVSLDQGNESWGCGGTNANAVVDVNSLPTVPETEVGARIGDGKANTDGIVQDCSSGYAADWCRDKGPEWFLPSRGELNELYLWYSTDKPGNNNLMVNCGGVGFAADYYWSSSEYSGLLEAWGQDFNNGGQMFIFKVPKLVRAVRAF